MRTRVKKWGNSLGLIIPSDVANNAGIKEGDEVEFSVKKCGDIDELFGLLRSKTIDAQEMKDETRKADMGRDERFAAAGAGRKK
jgi:antitoxin component of MazEF toxin-antitoxin module